MGGKIYDTKKSKERREESLGTMSYQTSSKWSPPFWLLIGARKTHIFWHQSELKTETDSHIPSQRLGICFYQAEEEGEN